MGIGRGTGLGPPAGILLSGKSGLEHVLAQADPIRRPGLGVGAVFPAAAGEYNPGSQARRWLPPNPLMTEA